MKALFYLLEASFRAESDMNVADLEEAIKLFAEDYQAIKNAGDKIYKHEGIYDVELLPKQTIVDVLYTPENTLFSKSVKKFLLQVIDHSKSTNLTNEEIIELINFQEQENLCETKEAHGLLGLLKIPQEIQDVYVVYNKRNWYEFHKYFLSKFPCEPAYFIDECNKYFPNLYLHERNKETMSQMEGVWHNFVQQILYCLACLNDTFPKYLKDRDKYQRIDALVKFSSETGIETSPQGNAKQKQDMTFEFSGKDICCEPHMKLSKSDTKGDTIFYFNRVYFHEGSENIHNGKILIGHIGKHIDF